MRVLKVISIVLLITSPSVIVCDWRGDPRPDGQRRGDREGRKTGREAHADPPCERKDQREGHNAAAGVRKA